MSLFSPESLATARRILLVGDLHANESATIDAVDTAVAEGVDLVAQVGDLGVGFCRMPGDMHGFFSDVLASNDLPGIFVPGNHDDYDQIESWPLDEHGFLIAGTHLRATPRGHRWNIGGRRFGAIGGAYSIDQSWRVRGRSWWPQEEITQADVDRLGDEPLDVLLTHEVPQGTPVLSHLRLPAHLESASAQGRELLREAVVNTDPAVVVSGHWHQRVTGMLRGRTRVEVLDMETEPGALAILDLADLTLAPPSTRRGRAA